MKDAGSHLPKVGRMLRTVLILIAIFFIVIFTLVWFAIVAGITFSAPFLTNFFPSKEGLTILMMINLLFVIGIPLVAIIISIVRLTWKRKMGRGWKTTLAILWLVNIISFTAVGGTLAQEFVAQEEVEQLLPMDNSTEILSLSYYKLAAYNDKYHYFINNEIELPGAPIHYAIKKSSDQTWRLNQLVSSRGKRAAAARDLAYEIELPLQIKDGSISSPQKIPFTELSKWRNQNVVLEVMVPVGKFIRIDYDVFRKIKGIRNYDYSRKNCLYLMTESGNLECQDCDAEQEQEVQGISSESNTSTSSSVTEQSPELADFDKISLSGPMKITIEHGTSYDVKIIGSGQDLAELEQELDGDVLELSLDMEITTAPVRIFITTPNLSELELESTGDVLLRGFNLENLDITASGEFGLKATIVVQALSLDISDGLEFEFTGEAQHINATLTNESRLDTDRGKVKEIILDVTDASKVKLNSSVTILEQDIDEDSSLRIVN